MKINLKKNIPKILSLLVVGLFVNLTVLEPPTQVYAAQPKVQAGTGTMKRQGIAWSSEGISFMYGGRTTSLSRDDVGYTHMSTTSYRVFPKNDVFVYAGNRRVLEGSRYVPLASGGYGYYNFQVTVNPANFTRNNLVRGRSLLDNLYLESTVNRDTLDKTLSNGGTGWANAMISARTSSASHSKVTTQRLWNQGASNYTAPERIYTTSKGILKAGYWGTGSVAALPELYDLDVIFPRIDDTPPDIDISPNDRTSWGKSLNVAVKATDPGSGLKRLQTNVKINGSWGAWSSWQTGSTKSISLNTTGEHKVVVRAEDNEGNYSRVYSGTYYVDTTTPRDDGANVYDARYVNGNDYWFRPGDKARIQVKGYDYDSRMLYSYVRLYGDGNDNRARHQWQTYDSEITEFRTTGGYTNVVGGTENYWGWTTRYDFDVNINANAGNRTFQVHTYHTDTARNINGYNDSGKRILTDATNPTISATSTNSGGWINYTKWVALTHSDGQSGVKTKQYKWSTSWYTPSSWDNYTGSITQSGNGVWWLHARVTDNVGRVTTERFGPYMIDKTAPSAGYSKSYYAWTKGNVDINISSHDLGGSGYYRTKLPNGSYTTSTSPKYTATANGTYPYTVYDNAGNSKTQSATVTNIDKTAPSGVISKSTTGWTRGNVTLTASPSDNESGYYRTRLPNGVYTTSTSPSYTATSNGTYSFVFYDNVGNTRTVSTTVSNIDKTIPSGSISKSTTGWTKGNVTLTLSQSDSGGSGYYRTRLPNGSYTTSTSPTYTATSNTSYSFVVYDHAGNSRTVSTTVSNIDRTAPTSGISKSTTSWTKGNVTLSLSPSDSQSGYYRTKLPNGTYTTSAAPTYTATSDGTYSFVLYDHAGNARTVSTSVTNIDKSAPTVSSVWIDHVTQDSFYVYVNGVADTGGSGVSTVRFPTWTELNGQDDLQSSWTSNPATIGENRGSGVWRYKVNRSAHNYEFGKYVIHPYVFDNAGNRTSTGISYVLKDQVAPTLSVSASTTNWTNGNVALTGTANDAHTGIVSMSLPDGTVVPKSAGKGVSTSHAYTVTSNGTYTFKATDQYGNVTTTSYTVSNIDKVRPTHSGTTVYDARYVNGNDHWFRPGDDLRIEISGHDRDSYMRYTYLRLAGDGNDNRAYHDWKSSDGHTATFDTGEYTDITGGTAPYWGWTPRYRFNVSVKANAGNRMFAVQTYFRDNAGNVAGYIDTSKRIRTDATNPTISASSTSRGWANSNVSVALTHADGQSGIQTKQYQWSTSTATPSSWNTYSGTTTQMSQGTWYLHARATDNVGHVTTERFGPYRIDKTNPTGSVNKSTTSWTNGNVNLTLAPSDAGGSGYYRTKLPNGTLTTSTSPSYTATSNGTYTFTVYDHAGNSRTVSTTVSNIDKTSPSGTTSGNPTSWTNGNATLKVSPSDTGGSGYYRTKLPNGSFTTSTSPSYTATSNGTYTFTVYDHAGNSRNVSVTVTKIDKTNPSNSITKTPTHWTNKPVTVLVQGQDTQSGISKIEQINQSTNEGRNFLRNSQLDYRSYSPSWNTALNGSLAPNGYWSGGYNGGVSNPTVGYHAHLNTSTFGYPVLRYVNKNSAYGQTNRWQGFSQAFGATSDIGKELSVGQDITVSFDIRSDKVGGTIHGGFYRYRKSTNSYGFVKTSYSKTTTSNTWERVSYTQTVDSDWDLTKTFRLYMYGSASDSEATKYVKNVKVELGNTDTPYTIAPEDAVTLGSDNLIQDSDIPTSYTPYNSAWTKKDAVTFETTVVRANYLTFRYNSLYNLLKSGGYVFSGYLYVDGQPIQPGSFKDFNTYYGSNLKIREDGYFVHEVSVNTTSWLFHATGQSSHLNVGSVVTLKYPKIEKGSNVEMATPYTPSTTNATNYLDMRTFTVSQNGTYTYRVTDVAGNRYDRSVSVSNIDTTKPNGSISGNPTSWTNQNVTLAFNATDSGGSNVKRVRRPDGTWVNGASTTHTVSSNGTYTFSVEDHAGNSRDVDVVVNRIDKVLPNGSISGNPTSWTKGNATLKLSQSDTGGSGYYRTRLPNGMFTTSTAPTYTATANGTYTFTIYDHAGNSRNVSVTVNRIDKAIPTGTISGNPTGWTNANATLVFHATDTGGSGVRRVRTPSGTWVNASAVSYTVSSNGTYTFRVEDHAGNTRDVVVTVNRIDKSLPGGTISGNPTSWTNQNVTLTFNATDSGDSGVRRVRKPNGTWVNGATTSFTVTSNGTYTFRAEDNAGNIRDVSVTVNRIDKVVPNGSISGNPSTWTNQDATLSFSATDSGGSGVRRVRRPNGTWVNGSSVSQLVKSNGTYTFRVQDHAGSIRDVSVNVTRIDKSSPAESSISIPSGQ